MIDTLGLHTDTDAATELAALQPRITALTTRVAIGGFTTYEDEHNTQADLTNLTARAARLTEAATLEAQELAHLADAFRTVGDPVLGFIGYVVYGPTILPMAPRHEIRMIERRGGYTVPGTVRRNVPSDQLAQVERELWADVLAPNGHAALWGHTGHDYRVQVLTY